MATKYSSLLPNADRATSDPEYPNILAENSWRNRQADISPKDAKAAADAVANMREVNAETERERLRMRRKEQGAVFDKLQKAVNPKGTAQYKKGGRVTGYKGYGIAKKV